MIKEITRLENALLCAKTVCGTKVIICTERYNNITLRDKVS